MREREILFRGKNDADVWHYGAYLPYESGEVAILESFSKYGYEAVELSQRCKVIPETVGQYTGLTDKNGKKIFEGDVFKFPDEAWESCYTSCGTEYNSQEVENYGVVGFAEYSAKYDFVKYKYNENSVAADLHENGTLDFAELLAELEIIGNIHDNPELLKGGVE